MKKTLAIIAVITLVIGSYYYGRYEGYVAGVLDTTVEQMMARPTYL
jgi:hypothetical protein